MITTGTTSIEIPSPLESPFTAYSRSDATYHAYFVFHTTSLSTEDSYLNIDADIELSGSTEVIVLRHNNLEDCYVIDVICPFFEYHQGESSAVTYHLTGKIYGENSSKHLNIDVNFTQEGCEITPGPIVETPFIRFTAMQNTSKLGLADRSSYQDVLQYSTDEATWEDFNTGVTITLENIGDSVLVRGIQREGATGRYLQFKTIEGIVEVSGNINSLWNFENLNQPLHAYCGMQLFLNCTGLVGAENLVLPADILADYCYTCMFSACVGLISSPELPATTLAQDCYYGMFQGCTSLATAPELPATILASGCYSSMFHGCGNLTAAPELPANTLANNCYGGMFSCCTSLTTLPELPASILSNSCYHRMFSGCVGLSGMPYNLLSAATLAPYCYSEMFSYCSNLTATTALPATELADGCYKSMFSYCTSLTEAPDLPATILYQDCYRQMFNYCLRLTTAPELPATTLASYCYYCMFSYCGLMTAPKLPATTLVDNCYREMFKYCTSLVDAPELPANTLTDRCYNSMFYNCTSLATAPELPATILASGCYESMFQGCINLNYIKCLATNISASNCTSNWVNGVASNGTFVKAVNMTGWRTGSDGIPAGWTID